MKELLYEYTNISDFYEDSIHPTPEGNAASVVDHLKSDTPSFRGLDLSTIQKSKFGYIVGLDKLEELELNVNVGGSSRKYIYDEFDGDDINYDRLLDGFSPMLKRIRSHGIGSGRLINIYVVISENCNIGHKEMLYKSHTAIRIVDMLESMGYRVAIWACDSTLDESGTYKEESGVRYEVRVCLKRHEDGLNKGLILNGISPWFFRYYIFAHQKGHYKNSWGMGRAVPLDLEQTKENIVINHGECLNESSADNKIKQIEKLFKVE